MTANFGADLSYVEDGNSNTNLIQRVRVGVNERDLRGTWGPGLCAGVFTCGNAEKFNSDNKPNNSDILGDAIMDCTLLSPNRSNSDTQFFKDLAYNELMDVITPLLGSAE